MKIHMFNAKAYAIVKNDCILEILESILQHFDVVDGKSKC
jgi:hypothetical protein